MKKPLIILGLIFVGFFGCKEDAVTEPAEYEITISGKVFDEAEVPLGFCDVTLLYGEETYNTNSNEEGFFTFSFVITELDSFMLNVQKEYYQTQSLLFSDLSEEEMKTIKIILPKTFVTISGVLTELDENGLHSSVGTKVLVHLQYVSWDTLQTETDENGGFSFLLDPLKYNKFAFEEIHIIVTKPNFIAIDTVIYNSNKNSLTDISLQITKIVNYFPINVGNQWEYYVMKDTSLTDYYSYKYEGTERWEIISVESDGKTFILNKYFTGTLQSYFQLGLTDTEYFENHKTSYNLKYENGVIISSIAEGKVPFGLKGIIFLHPITNDGIYSDKLDISGSGHYKLEYGKGIIEYGHEKDLGWANMFNIQKLELLTFTQGG